MRKIIIGENIIKSFREGDEERNVLDGVSIEIWEGEFIAVMGPSGSGKSTLMSTLSGMDSINEGKVFFDGKDLSTYNENKLASIRRTEMGFVFQQATMLENLNILDNIILPAILGNRKNTSVITEKAKILMKKVGIEELGNRDITQISGGQLQRAGICRALMNNPKIIFGDEPTGALNSKTAQVIMDIFSEINAKGTTVMLVTHDVKVAAKSERIMFMNDGKIVDEISLPKFNGKNVDVRIKRITDKMQEIGI